MSEQNPPPLDAETLAILRAEKDPPGAPLDVAARVFGRLQMSISDIAAPAAGHDAPAADAPAQALAEVGRGAAGLARVVQLAAAFAAGGVAGASAHAWHDRSVPDPSSIVEKPTLTERSSVPPEPTTPPLIVDIETPSPSATPPPASSASDLSAERALLDQAQRAFARGDIPASLASLNAHARKFPRGHLEEEREALAVKSLVATGRYDEARTRGARFHGRFPDSFLLPTVDDALRSIP